MSLLLGTPTARWPLSRAVDALADSARRAGVPGLIWIVGIWYPSLNLSWDLVRSLVGAIEQVTQIEFPGSRGTGHLVTLFVPHLWPGVEKFWTAVWLYLASLPLLPLYSRLVVGLAKISDPVRAAAPAETSDAASPRSPRRHVGRFRDAWREGKGLGFVALGMWLILVGLLLGAMLFLIGPLVLLVQLFQLEELSPLFIGLFLPVLIVLLLYTVVLQVVNQLALHSLAHNRRGIASALTHAWRLIRISPWSATRATLVDFVLFVTVLGAVAAVDFLLPADAVSAGFGTLLAVIAALLAFGLYGFAGVTRAGFWARTYRALGGLSAEDHVPGL